MQLPDFENRLAGLLNRWYIGGRLHLTLKTLINFLED